MAWKSYDRTSGRRSQNRSTTALDARIDDEACGRPPTTPRFFFFFFFFFFLFFFFIPNA